MMKMTFTLAAALYAGFVIWGTPEGGTVTAGAAQADSPRLATAQADFAAPVILNTEASSRSGDAAVEAAVTRTVVPDAAVIAASAPDPSETFRTPALIGAPQRVSLRASAEPVAVRAPAPAAAATAEAAALEAGPGLMQVTGSRVNLRAGPSTGNAVVDSLVRGTVVEPLGAPIDGWQELRAIDTGVTGFMSSNFLAPS